MSVKGIKPGQVIPFPNKPVEKKTEKSVENRVFSEDLDKAQADKKSYRLVNSRILRINKANNISKIKHSVFPHISLLFLFICKLLAQEWHKLHTNLSAFRYIF